MNYFLSLIFGITFLMVCSHCYSQNQKSVTGRYVNNEGNGIPGATISVKGTTIGTTTDLDGKFSLKVPEGAVLVVSFVGMNKQEVKVLQSSMVDILLTENGMLTRYWCCTSHPESPHCAKQKSDLKKTHPSKEIYILRNP